MSGGERERCEYQAGKHEFYWRRSPDAEIWNRTSDLARLIERERAHAAATALFVERVAVWLAAMAQVGAAVALSQGDGGGEERVLAPLAGGRPMNSERAANEVTGIDLSLRAKQVAEDLGYGPGGKNGGVILVVVDHDAGQSLCAHAGGNSQLFEALLSAFNEMLKKSAELLGGERVVSSVRKWREGLKKS